MKPATDAKTAAALNGFTEVVFRGNNFIACKNSSTKKISLDIGIGNGWHYNNNTLESNSAWETDIGAWQYKIEKVDGFKLNARNVLNAGNLIQWTDIISGQSINFQPMALNWVEHLASINDTGSRQQITQPQAITAQITDDIMYFPNGYGTGRHFKYVADVARLSKLLIIDSLSNLPVATVANPYLEIEFIITPSSGVSLIIDGVAWDKKTKTNTANSIVFKTSNDVNVWSFASPIAYDSAGNVVNGIIQVRKQGANFYCTVRFPKTWIDSAEFPIYLDPTIDYQVGASANDCQWTNTFSDNGASIKLGNGLSTAIKCAFRFTGVTIPLSATIDTSYLTFYYNNSLGTPPACVLSGEDAANPAAITSASDGNGRTLTTNNISVTSPGSGTWWNTNSINAIIQELVNSYNYASGSAMQFIVVGNTGDTYYGSVYAYDGDTSKAAKLHIEYTESVTGNPYYAYAQQ